MNRANLRGATAQTEALADYGRALALEPNNGVVYNNRALLYAAQGNSEAALADYRKAAELYQQQGNTQDYQRLQPEIERLQASARPASEVKPSP